MATTFNLDRGVTPVSSVLTEQIASFGTYNVVSGCTASYSAANLTVTIAAGQVRHNGTLVTVAGNTVTLTADTTNPRYGWIGIASNGTATYVAGTPAASAAVPELGDYVMAHLVLIPANLTIANNATSKLDVRVVNSFVPSTYKYMAATQTFSASTTFANLVASASGTFSFAIPASEAWLVTCVLSVTTNGSGGLKLQFTGPASPTRVDITGKYDYIEGFGPTDGDAGVLPHSFRSQGTAFSTVFAALNATGLSNANEGNYLGAGVTEVAFTALIVNGTTAGTVTLQGAQNAANSTTVFAIGSWMRAERIG